MLEPDLLIVSADLDGVWDELGSLLLGHRGHVFQQDSDLYREEERCTLCVCVCVCVYVCVLYSYLTEGSSVSILICKQVL